MKKTGKQALQWVFIPLFLGSLWGIAEATAGHVLHLLQIPGLAGLLMFPVGLFFMVRAYFSTGRLSSVFLTSMIAANVKLVDLFLPIQTPFMAINPALAILCESIPVILFFSWKDFKHPRYRLVNLWIMAVSWRLLHGLSLVFMGFLFPVSGFFDLGIALMVRFFVLESLVNGILIYLMFGIGIFPEENSSWNLRRMPVLSSVLMFLIAITVEFFI